MTMQEGECGHLGTPAIRPLTLEAPAPARAHLDCSAAKDPSDPGCIIDCVLDNDSAA